MRKILYGNSEKSFLECEKMASRNIFRQFFLANFFMFVLLISNHTVFLVQFGINLHLWVFQKAEIALAEAARAISAFWKTHSCKLIPNWTRNRMITYTNLHWCYTFCTGVTLFALVLHLNCTAPSQSESSNFFICIIKGVIARVISKSGEREARGRFEITSTITPWIVRHEVQLLINRIFNKFRN